MDTKYSGFKDKLSQLSEDPVGMESPHLCDLWLPAGASLGCWMVAVGGAKSALRPAFGSCNVPRECQQLGELPVGAMEAAAVFPDLSHIPEFWLLKEDLLELRRRAHQQSTCCLTVRI